MKRYITLCFLLTILARATAQPYIIENFNMRHGMSNNYAVDLTEDRRGYIWIATGAGLNRFDGSAFTVFTKYNSNLSSNELNTVLADPAEDKVWIGTQRDGLCVYDYEGGGIISVLTTRNGMTTNDITDLTASSANGIWVTHYHYGIDHYDRETGTFTPYTSQNIEGFSGHCWTTEEDGQGNLYVGHDGQGMSIISLKDRKAVNYRHDPNDKYSLPSNIVRAIHIDNNKNIWVGTDKGLTLFNPKNGRFTNFRHDERNDFSILSDQIYDITQMKDGTLWICSNMGGVSILNLQGSTFISPGEIIFFNIPATNNHYGLSSPNARCALQDTFGNIWIGNFRGGLDFISHTQPIFNQIGYHATNRYKSEFAQVWGVYAEDDRIWIGGENELVMHTDKTTERFSMKAIQAHPQTHINVILKDSHGRLWLGLYKDGIAYYDTEKKRFHRVGDASAAELDVRALYEDPDGKIWIGAEEGLYSYDREWKKETETERQLPDKNIHGIVKDNQGKLWIGTFGKGISIFGRDGKLIHTLTSDNHFPSNAINHLTEDSQGRIWAATREGLVGFHDVTKPTEYVSYSIGEGLANTQVRAIQEDLKGNIWVSTNAGISKLNEAKKEFHNYNHLDGIPMGDFMDGSACITPKGIIHFGSQNGVCYFNPNELAGNRKVAPIRITQLTAYDKADGNKECRIPIHANKKEIELTYRQNTFTLSFNVLDYSQSSQVEFSYKLKGYSNEWFNAENGSQVEFRNLPHGNYTFIVRARFRNQTWEDHKESLDIRIAPPFWLSWYAKLFYVLLGIAILYTLLRIYKNRLQLEGAIKLQQEREKNLQELNDEKLRFFTNITHELRTPLTLILGPLEDLLGDDTLPAKHNKKISIIHNSSLRLLNLINHILEFRKTQTQNRKLSVAKGNLAHVIQDVGLKYKELNQNPSVDYRISIESEDTYLFFDEEVINMIVDNLMSNAMKYTTEGEICLSLRNIEENQLEYTEISVTDTGHGIAPEALPHLFDRYYQANSQYQTSGSGIGLALVKSLADLHEGVVSVESVLEKGSTFRFRLLRNNTYPNAQHKEARTQMQEPTITATEAEEGGHEERPIILIVEDNADIREYVQSSLDDHFQILTARNGKEGLETAQAQIPNVIVCDVMMPVMDGLELCRQLKKDIRTCHIPVVLLTAKNSLQDKEAGYAAGADSYLTKPFSANLLHSRINNILTSRKMMASMLAEPPKPQSEEEPGNNRITRLDNEFLKKVTELIEENLETEKLDIAFIAEKMCMSHSTLYRKIKGLTDMSANEYIRKVKMRKSVELLKEGYNISEIAFMLGFSSTSYFRLCFKDEYGMSPTEYIKKKP